MRSGGTAAPSGSLGLNVIRGGEPPVVLDGPTIARLGLPQRGLGDEVNAFRARNLRNLGRGALPLMRARAARVPVMIGALYASIMRGDDRVDLGLISLRVVTTAGVGYIVDALQNITEAENLKYHGFGTGTNAEASSDTALQTELTTEYATDNVRPTGTLAEGASGNIFRTVATLAPDGAGNLAITEHGIFSQAATGGGVLLDRSVFSALNLTRGTDSLQTTYELTVPSGS